MNTVRRNSLSSLALASLISSLPACDDGGSRDGSASGAAGAGGAGVERPTGAIYRVPVPDALSAWASYPVEEVELEREGADIEISYPFPRWLSGDSEKIVLEGAYSNAAEGFPVTAEQGSGTCTHTGARFECLESLPGLEVDREKARDRMLDAGLSAQEIEQRLEVTRIFEADPIGILEFELER